MESLQARVSVLETAVDLHKASRTAAEGLSILARELQALIDSNKELSKLFKHLNNSSVKFHLDHTVLMSEDELDLERQVVYGNFDEMVFMAEQLARLHTVRHGETLEVDCAVVKRANEIRGQFGRLQRLEMRYNELLIRSIALLQNML